MGYQQRQLFASGSKESISVPAGSKIAVKVIGGSARVYQSGEFTNIPANSVEIKFINNEEWVSSAFSTAATLEIVSESGSKVFYSIGTDPVVMDDEFLLSQDVPGSLNATGTLTAALTFGRIVTSTTASAVTATLDTGAIFDAANSFEVGDSFDWTVIVTGATNAFTVTASTGHTVVGENVVLADISANFRTKKTAADTFITYKV